MTRLALLLFLAAMQPAEQPAKGTAPRLAPRAAQVAPRPAAARPLPDSAVAAIRADPRYRYDAPEAERPSLRERVWQWILEHVLAPTARGSLTPLGRTVWFGLAVLIVAVVAVRLFTTGIGGFFGRRDPRARDDADPLAGADAIEDVDLAGLLGAATARRDWRAAVRLRYLVALQRLDARGVVRWAPDKTNRAFVHEASARGGADVGRAFGEVTRAFEVVWYGGLSVDAARYARIAARFERLDVALSAAPARVAGSRVAG